MGQRPTMGAGEQLLILKHLQIASKGCRRHPELDGELTGIQ